MSIPTKTSREILLHTLRAECLPEFFSLRLVCQEWREIIDGLAADRGLLLEKLCSCILINGERTNRMRFMRPQLGNRDLSRYQLREILRPLKVLKEGPKDEGSPMILGPGSRLYTFRQVAHIVGSVRMMPPHRAEIRTVRSNYFWKMGFQSTEVTREIRPELLENPVINHDPDYLIVQFPKSKSS